MRRIFLILSCLSVGSLKAQQVTRNLGFEYLNVKGYISSWDTDSGKDKYILKLDTTVAHSGKCSFYVASGKDSSNRGNVGATSYIISPNLSTKRILRITAYVKTRNLSDGVASIGMQLNGANSALRVTNSNGQSKPGTENWKMHVIELPITPDVKNVVFGTQMTGKGEAWFDDFEISFDDIPLGNTVLIP